MAELAAGVAAALAPTPISITRSAMIHDAPPDRYVGNADAWRTLLVAQRRVPMPFGTIVADTVADLAARGLATPHSSRITV